MVTSQPADSLKTELTGPSSLLPKFSPGLILHWPNSTLARKLTYFAKNESGLVKNRVICLETQPLAVRLPINKKTWAQVQL